MERLTITAALKQAIEVLNQIPNRPVNAGDAGATTTYKLIPQLESALAHHGAALEAIAAFSLWGEPIEDLVLRDEYIACGEYSNDDLFTPSSDTECNMLREAVETVRLAIGQPVNKE